MGCSKALYDVLRMQEKKDRSVQPKDLQATVRDFIQSPDKQVRRGGQSLQEQLVFIQEVVLVRSISWLFIDCHTRCWKRNVILATDPPSKSTSEVLLLSGLSGSGKSTAVRLLESSLWADFGHREAGAGGAVQAAIVPVLCKLPLLQTARTGVFRVI